MAVVYLPQVTDQVFDTANRHSDVRTKRRMVGLSEDDRITWAAVTRSLQLLFAVSNTNLGHSALTGLGRILHTEHPEIWGSLIDLEDPSVFPLMAMRCGLDCIQT
jgi:6-methylsalicylic acid synthase